MNEIFSEGATDLKSGILNLKLALAALRRRGPACAALVVIFVALGLPRLTAAARGLARPGPSAVASATSPPHPAVDAIPFNGARAFDDLKKLVSFGPRPSGSKALDSARAWMLGELKASGCAVTEDSFTAATPAGSIAMTNLIVKIPGAKPDVVMVAGHYDTKRFDQFTFVGANDGGSSAALLVELGRQLCHRRPELTTWLVFFDGEEAVRTEWSNEDSVYGSKHLAAKLTAAGDLGRIKAMILVDMIGDSNLDIKRDTNSTPWLADVVFDAARRLGYAGYFLNEPYPVGGDDYVPFINAGVSAIDIIDFDYGPNNSYWHTAQDTVAHCSPQSLSIVGRVVLETLHELAARSL